MDASRVVGAVGEAAVVNPVGRLYLRSVGMRASSSLRPCFLALLVTVAAPAGCMAPLDTTRVVETRGTLGEEIYRNVCERIASSELPSDVSGASTRELCRGAAPASSAPTPRLRALATNRARLVAALDAALPVDLHDDLRGFLLQLLPLYDPPTETIPGQTRAVATLIAGLATDDAAIATLARFGQHEGYRPLRLGLGVTRPVLAYPQFDDVARTLLATIDDGGAAAPEWQTMLQTVALSMAAAQRDPLRAPGDPSTLDVARQLLFTENDAFETGTPRFVVLRDTHGTVLPVTVAGAIAPPFVDADLDGTADVDPTLGFFLDARGGRLSVAAPFPILRELPWTRDPYGRAQAADGSLLYQYLDANHTLLAGITREATPWVDPAHPSVLDLAQGIPVLLGPTSARTAAFGRATMAFDGPDTSRGALFDFLHATGTVLGKPETDDALLVANTLLTSHESALAGVIAAAWAGNDSGDTHPAAALVAPSDLWDDVLHTAEGIAQTPGMLEAFLRASADPATQDLGGVNAQFMRYADAVTFDPSNLNGPPVPAALTQRTDFTRPDDSIANESLFQRSLLAIDDLNGVRVCNKEGATVRASVLGLTVVWPLFGSYHECELFRIDNVAEFYAASVVGAATLDFNDGVLRAILSFLGVFGVSTDALLESSSGITGLSQHPTPQALARLVFGPPNPFVDALVDDSSLKRGCTPGVVACASPPVPVRARHATTVPAWEKTFLVNGHNASFLTALRPLIQVFVDHDPPGGRFLFGELIHDLAVHWPSPGATRTQNTSPAADLYAHRDNGRSYEPIVADLFDQGQLFQRLSSTMRATAGVTVRPGTDGVRALANATQVLVDPERSCTGGSCATGTPLAYRDGRTWPCSNTGVCFDGVAGRPRRYVSPIYLIVDALDGFDAAFAAPAIDPQRHVRWLSARHVIANQLLRTTGAVGSEQLADRRSRAILLTVVPFVRARIAAHRTAGDLDTWAPGLTGRAEIALGSPEATTILAVVDAIQRDPAARDQLAALASYLFDESSANDAFTSTLVGTTDLLQLLADDADMTPLLNSLSTGIAPSARSLVLTTSTAPPSTGGSAVDQTVHAIRAINDVDDTHALRRVLTGMVTIQSATGADPVTPLETIIDVIAEVNRAHPGAGGTFGADDYRTFLGRTNDFLVDHDRGFERLYDVVQHRTLPAP